MSIREQHSPDEFDRLLTSVEAATVLGVSGSKLEQLIGDGNIPVVRFGRIRRIRSSVIRAFIDRLDDGAERGES